MRFTIDRASLTVTSKFIVFALFYFVVEGNFPSTSNRGAYIWRGALMAGFLCYRLGGYIWSPGLYMEGLIFGILRYVAIVRGDAIFSLLRCYTITVLTKILLYLLLCCYTMAGGAIIFFAICYYVVRLLPAVLLFSSLYYRHCCYFLSCYSFKFRAWIIFGG